MAASKNGNICADKIEKDQTDRHDQWFNFPVVNTNVPLGIAFSINFTIFLIVLKERLFGRQECVHAEYNYWKIENCLNPLALLKCFSGILNFVTQPIAKARANFIETIDLITNSISYSPTFIRGFSYSLF